MPMSTTTLRLRRIAREWLPVVLMIGLLLAARSTLADHYHVPSGSMESTLMPGDHVIPPYTPERRERGPRTLGATVLRYQR